MDETTRRARFARHADDVCLLGGLTALGMGTGIAFGYAYGLMVVGALLIAFGVWLISRTEK